jgi:hypothetical protein
MTDTKKNLQLARKEVELRQRLEILFNEKGILQEEKEEDERYYFISQIIEEVKDIWEEEL